MSTETVSVLTRTASTGIGGGDPAGGAAKTAPLFAINTKSKPIVCEKWIKRCIFFINIAILRPK
jgi:hypothetical protein